MVRGRHHREWLDDMMWSKTTPISGAGSALLGDRMRLVCRKPTWDSPRVNERLDGHVQYRFVILYGDPDTPGRFSQTSPLPRIPAGKIPRATLPHGHFPQTIPHKCQLSITTRGLFVHYSESEQTMGQRVMGQMVDKCE